MSKPRPLPADITLDALRRQAARSSLPEQIARERVARRYGFLAWRQIEVHVDRPVPGENADFLHPACLNYHHDRPIFRQRARAMLERDPSLAARDIRSAACAGATDHVARMLDADPALINARGGWFDWEPLARLLLDAGADPNDGQALYNRMFSRDDRCLELLLEYGLNRRHRINWRSGKGWTLDYQLDWAVRKHHVARAKLLVEHGADPTRRLEDGTTLSKAALLAGHPEIAEFLRRETS